ncbi:MAG: hypothetical protein DRH26_06950 [Deltaproteobacteria bacterium]|nr:MAG: hypothetical protein DRH26_06950 [Deltaproteobacteria bacterium]
MKFEQTVWTIGELINVYDSGKINLRPSYQRNLIWTAKAQKQLIDTIKKNQPIPNFILKQNGSDSYEMVDGPQRARTILGYVNLNFPDLNEKYYNDEIKDTFLNYPLSITLITKLSEKESIEAYYSLINSKCC